MTLLPSPWWLPALLAAVLFADILLSMKPVRFIRECLESVRFPREWWWTLLVIKALAVVGLVVGIWIPGVALAATAGVITYFLCAAAAHLRAKATGSAFWVNCLGMLIFSCAVMVLSFL